MHFHEFAFQDLAARGERKSVERDIPFGQIVLRQPGRGQDIYHVNRVVARIYNPRRASIYEKLNLQTVSSSTWGAHRIEQLLVHPGMQSISSAGNGEVQVYEFTVPAEWNGHKVSDLVPMEHAIPVALARNGKGILPRFESLLTSQDVLQVSSTPEGVKILRERIHENGNGHRKES